MLKVGELLDEKYRIVTFLGKGRWGRVYLAEHIKLGNRWAIKEISTAGDARVNLLAEPNILKKLNHPSLPRITDILHLDDLLYIVEDYFEGQNLRDLIEHSEICSEENVLKWGSQLCQILVYLHGIKPYPIIYRDMKPGNVIIDRDSNARLIDFGIAREFDARQESDSTFIGTIGYAAPEQYSMGGRSDERTDIYGLGVTLYHLLTGINPSNHLFALPPVRTVQTRISPSLAAIITRCIEQHPDNRYQTAKELLADLNKAREETAATQNSSLLTVLKKQFMHIIENEVVFVEKLVGTVVIAVGGTNRGVGCTHLAISLAAFLARQKFAVAVLEMNENPVFHDLDDRNAANGRIEGSFNMGGIDFCWQNVYNRGKILAEVLRGDYDFVVIDMGRLLKIQKSCCADIQENLERNPWYDELLRANIQILVAGSAVWQVRDLAPYLNEAGFNKWEIIFPAPNQPIFKQLSKQFKKRAYFSEFSPDPFTPNEHQDNIFSKILERVLPQKKAAPKRMLFWKR